MPPKHTDPAASPFNVGDIYFLLFRYKWVIIPCFLLGITAAALIYFTKERAYVSEAQILVKYVSDRTSMNPAARDENVRSTDPQGGTILNSEMQIMKSRDLADSVVENEDIAVKILAKLGGGSNAVWAANHIVGNLKCDIAGRSSVIALSYEHPDPSVAQAVLRLLVDKYVEKHLEIHRAAGAYKFLQAQTGILLGSLSQTEAALHSLRTNAGVLSIDAAKATFEKQMAQLREAIAQQEAEVEARRAMAPKINLTNAVASTVTNTAPLPASTNRDAGLYRSLCDTLDNLRAREIEMLSRYTEANPALIGIRAQIVEIGKRKQDMETADPQLGLLARPTATGEKSAILPDRTVDLPTLEAHLAALKRQWDRLRVEAAGLDKADTAIKDLERRKKVEEENYHAFATSLERARIDQAIDSDKLTSISVVQAASLPAPAAKGLMKPIVMATGGGLALGIALALLFEFIINPTVKRPADFRRGSMPLMMTIPMMNGHHSPRRSLFRRRKPARDVVTHIDSLPEVAEHSHPLRPYFEALRDRLLIHFENITRKPKLVGVTSCSRGAGSSSIAAGIAAALSETGDGNVLLVDMNFEQGSAHQFFKGKPVCALTDAVQEEKRGTGLVQENLYLASINQINGSGHMVASKKLAEFMPKLRDCDYDYIIFDMPPVSATSITLRMAGLMDKTLLVIESERTHRTVVSEAQALLAQVNARAEAVLNRHQRIVPRLLAQELTAGAASS